MSKAKPTDYTTLYRQLGYQFNDQTLLETALSHSSYGSPNNERLEFLGDAILGWIIAEHLFQRFPSGQEGQLSRLRSRLVKGDTLAELARSKNIGDYLRLGQGELKSGGFKRSSILADAMEAIIGAIYLDAGETACAEVVTGWYADRLATLTLEDGLKDPKTRLQEFLQARKHEVPRYKVTATIGKDHQQTFTVSCTIDPADQPFVGKGSSRRKAEQAAAAIALAALGE